MAPAAPAPQLYPLLPLDRPLRRHGRRSLGLRHLDSGRGRDREGRLRLVYQTPRWEDFVALAVMEIRNYGASSVQVARRLRAMLENLMAGLPGSRVTVLEEELRLLDRAVERAFAEPAERARALTADYQGVGSYG